ncbi:uncharacterized protein LOC113330021 isoform X1 [Papaver somniferum]|uniref:uncharacterized protein LOC113330021 isoform X1 n=1 Tax=Papaver somniferum TaxID=3469 RepID=UPI000E702E12|nr:uncharacterized protein LOC113330021 isoform X1 [Papaver somniferum]
MAIEVANVRSNGVMVSEEEETTKVVVPTKIEEAGRKYCCATCFNSYGRVTHVALEKRVTLKTARRDELRSQLYWSATYMDREKVVLLDEEEENEIASGDSEIARMTYLMAANKVEA